MVAPDQSYWDRIAALGEMASGVAGIAAPIAAARAIGVPAASAMMEGLLGGSPTGQAAGDMARRFAPDESGALPGAGRGQDLPTPRNEAEAMARDILQLRAEGRADEVTEQMMAAADDQYMYFNTPLPMDTASRMARAERPGFRTDQPLYRGDANPNMQAFNTGQFAREGIGVTASDSPSVASTYMTGNNPAMYPLYARAENPLMVDVGGRNWTGIPAEAETNYGRLNDVLPPENYLDEDNLFDLMQGSGVDWGDGTSSSLAMANTDNVSRAAQAGGFDQIQFQNIVDRGGAGKYYTSAVNEPRTTVMTADPANVRSRFARFDPAFAHLRNLSAGVGGAAVLTALGDDAEAGTPETQIIGLVNQAGIAGAAEALGVSRRDIEEAISIVLPPSQWDQLVIGPK
jgi:hypothetical protein